MDDFDAAASAAYQLLKRAESSIRTAENLVLQHSQLGDRRALVQREFISLEHRLARIIGQLYVFVDSHWCAMDDPAEINPASALANAEADVRQGFAILSRAGCLPLSDHDTSAVLDGIGVCLQVVGQ